MTFVKKPRPVVRTWLFIIIFMIIIPSFWGVSYNNDQINSETKFLSQEILERNSIYSNSSYNPRNVYTYHNYQSLEENITKLNQTFPDLIEVYTAQELYGLPDCKDGYKIWVIRITNESLGFDKPEVLFLGGHHGNEPISIEAPYYMIEFLLHNYQKNDFVRFLLDNREIYVIPVLNPWGWENNIREDSDGEDVNRDYPYASAAGNIPMTTIGAQTVAEIMKRHVFVLSLSWHSGEHLIYYAWGTPVHDTISDESPDNLAFFEVAKLMSDHAGGDSKYPYGPANQMFYAGGVRGAWSDYAYAATWDTDHVLDGYETPGARSLALGIEISKVKKPDESLLGNAGEVLTEEAESRGFVSQNIRMALVMIDLAKPYVTWHDDTLNIPTQATAGSKLNLSWYVNGSYSVTKTRILFGTNPDVINNYKIATEDLSGDSSWDRAQFSQEVVLPEVPGDYYFVAHASVDQSSLIQVSPDPDLPTQSFFVQQRTNNSLNVTIDGNTLMGSSDWYSSVIRIRVITEPKNLVWISDYDNEAYCNEDFNITWNIINIDPVNYTDVYWGKNQDPIQNHEFKTYPQAGGELEYFENITLPSRPGYYYFVAHMNVFNQTNDPPAHENDYWSDIISLEVRPRSPLELQVSLPQIEYSGGRVQTLKLDNIICQNTDIADDPLNESAMHVHKAVIQRFDPETRKYLLGTGVNTYEYNLEWSVDDGHWFLPTKNVTSWTTGWYQVVCTFEHTYGRGSSDSSIDLYVSNWFKIEHVIIVSQPELRLNVSRMGVRYIDILNITAWCSNIIIGDIEVLDAVEHVFLIKNATTNDTVLMGNLTWSAENSTWEQMRVNISGLSEGKYYILCKFKVNEVGTGISDHEQGDLTEFIVLPETDTPDKKKDDEHTDSNDAYIITSVILFIVIIFVLFLVLTSKKNQKKKKKRVK